MGVALAACWLAMASAATRAPASHRALWVWDHGDSARNLAARTRLFAFAAEHGVDTLYYESSRLVRTDPQDLVRFLQASAVNHLSVELLFSSNTWIHPGDQATGVALVQAAVRLASSMRQDRPTALHFDIEPYLTAEWKRGQTGRVEENYLHLLQKLEAARGPFPVHVDIPFWFYRVPGLPMAGAPIQPLDQEVLSIVDGCTLMDYRDVAEGSDGLIADGQHVLSDADRLGKPVLIGVETNPVKPSLVTFYEEGAGALRSQLARVSSAFGRDPSFAGTAVEDYRGYGCLGP